MAQTSLLLHQAPFGASGPLLILTGPTAVGKTTLSLELAERWGAEIISADSRQIYRELTIGTAKPSPDELGRVRHHFVDELGLGEPFSAGRFARAAEARIRDIQARGRVPLVVGGSALYLHALAYGFADVPDVDPAVRGALTERLAAEGAGALYAELKRVDPRSAKTMDPSKTQRLVRALEVYYGTGRPLSAYHAEQAPPPRRCRFVVLGRERAELYARINRRVEHMLEAGLVSEVEALRDAGFSPDLNALRTIGYQEVFAHLRGEVDYEEMVRLIKRNSRRYAKRQLTWFRRLADATWLEMQ